MADPPKKPAKTDKAGEQVIAYDIRVDIEVKATALDEKRLAQLIDDRIRRLASTIQNHQVR
jgi:hypothetical protein